MMKNLIILALIVFIAGNIAAQVSDNETQALLDLYNSTDGDNWNQKWDTSKEVANWAGVTVENNHVVEVRMLFNNLSGTLPSSLRNLTELRVLELSFNNIKGTLPSEMSSLSNLELLALNGNKLTGSIPASFGTLSNLKQLHLSSNLLSGALPNSINNLNKLEVFNVFDNQLSGGLPLGLTSNRNLREFMVAENNFENSNEISKVLLINSGSHIDLKENKILNPAAKSIIAIETSDDEN